MFISVILLFLSLVFSTYSWFSAETFFPVLLIQKSLVEFTSTINNNEENGLFVRQIGDTSILEVKLLNNTKKPISFVQTLNSNDIEIQIKDYFGNLVEKRKKEQAKSSDEVIFKPNEGSRQIVIVPPGESEIIAKIDINNEFDLTSGVYYVILKKRVWFEGEKNFQWVASDELEIQIKR